MSKNRYIWMLIMVLAIFSSRPAYAQRIDTIPPVLIQEPPAKQADTLKINIDENFPPEFPGGAVALQKFLSKNIRWKKGMKNGKVVVAFTMGADGYLKKIKIIDSVSPLNDAEVLQVINTMPKWVPVSKIFKTVDGKFLLPISFLNDRVVNSPPTNSHHP